MLLLFLLPPGFLFPSFAMAAFISSLHGVFYVRISYERPTVHVLNMTLQADNLLGSNMTISISIYS